MGDCDEAISKIFHFEDGDQAGEALKSVVLGLSRRDKNYWDKVEIEIHDGVIIYICPIKIELHGQPVPMMFGFEAEPVRVVKEPSSRTMTNLTFLEIEYSKLKKIENLDTLVHLRELYMGYNEIAKIENLDSLVNLEILILEANRIEKIENLDKLLNLEVLFLSKNKIQTVENLAENKNLKVLNLSKNRLKSIANLESLEHLEALGLNHNRLADWENIELLKRNKALLTVQLESNPLVEDIRFRSKLHNILPQLLTRFSFRCAVVNPRLED